MIYKLRINPGVGKLSLHKEETTQDCGLSTTESSHRGVLEGETVARLSQSE
jgi:hypothetical protein